MTTTTGLAALALLAVAAGGCAASLGELRETPPMRSAIVTYGSAPELAACTLVGLETHPATEGRLDYRVRTVGDRSYITGAISGVGWSGWQSVPFFDATFTTPSPGQVLIEARRQGIGPGHPKIAERDLWPIVERCAGLPVVAR